METSLLSKLYITKLIELGADFSAVDYTDFHGDPNFAYIQNNPLKSLIICGSSNSTFDQTIRALIGYIGQLPCDQQQIILSQKDRYPGGSISHLEVLLRQAKVDIAQELLKLSTPVSHKDLILACCCFGSIATRNRNVQDDAAFIKELYSQLPQPLTQATKDECILWLTKCNEKWYEEKKKFAFQMVAKWPNDSFSYKTVMGTFDPPRNFEEIPKEELIQRYVQWVATSGERIHGDINDEWCTVEDKPSWRTRIDSMQTSQGRQLRQELVDLISTGLSSAH